jgi:prepilin-type N-terminal cleavage/methylation domain-containing protein
MTRIVHHTVRRAYTLIELLIVIGILGLAGALLIPHLVQGDTLTIQGVVRQIIADITFAQSDALAHQEYRRLHFYDDGTGYCIYRIPDGGLGTSFDADTADYVNDPLAPAGEFDAYVVRFDQDEGYEGITISEVKIDGDKQFISFDELGGTVTTTASPGTGGTIIVSSPNSKFEITIAGFTGKLTVKELDAD